jgi:hypothetical protein
MEIIMNGNRMEMPTTNPSNNFIMKQQPSLNFVKTKRFYHENIQSLKQKNLTIKPININLNSNNSNNNNNDKVTNNNSSNNNNNNNVDSNRKSIDSANDNNLNDNKLVKIHDYKSKFATSEEEKSAPTMVNINSQNMSFLWNRSGWIRVYCGPDRSELCCEDPSRMVHVTSDATTADVIKDMDLPQEFTLWVS